jgi:AcrR family transcriptional regulator
MAVKQWGGTERTPPTQVGPRVGPRRARSHDTIENGSTSEVAMRYTKGHKQATRQRILEAAGRRFKQDGIDGAGVAAVMSDAGLTNGAFYAHFASKEDLVANVLADQLRVQRQNVDAQPPARAGLEAFIRAYLSPQHRDQCADGCPSAALLDEIVRRPAATRQLFTDELLSTADDLAARLDGTDAEAARTDALTILGFMIGTLQLARALTDRDLSDQLLTRSRETTLKLLEDRA